MVRGPSLSTQGDVEGILADRTSLARCCTHAPLVFTPPHHFYFGVYRVHTCNPRTLTRGRNATVVLLARGPCSTPLGVQDSGQNSDSLGAVSRLRAARERPPVWVESCCARVV